ncbi:MAG: GNAT family N-acetyltransferase [Bacteroidales bacterium]|jgi:GNAT superfamily N-acetyltransferase|nr:GNAT family N-acetyltransferase [Bacteroidales bacterium]
MEIISYTPTELKVLIESELYKKLEQIPISYHRAISHIQNPAVQDDDELLWAAYENEKLTGYVGVLPNYIVENQVRNKTYWLSCFWVDEKYRKENVASLLFFSLIKRCGKQLIVSNFLPNLEKMYLSIGIFKPTFYKTGSQFFCKSCFHNILPVRFPKIRFIKPLLKFGDWIINVLLFFRKMFFKPLNINSVIAVNSNFDDEFQAFLQLLNKNRNYIERFSAHFNWIIKYPWVLQGKQDKESKRYFFSSKSEQFCYDSVKFYQNCELKAFLLLKIRDKKLTVSFIFSEDEMLDDVAAYILRKVRNEKLIMLTVFDDRISNKIRNHRIQYIFERLIKRAYILPKTLNITPDIFQEGDGDNVFT